ncbi:nitrous oxide reductase accessory protein NosL [Lacibacter sp. MH-610]|uniref:nitrous oxide reductase accessory protein NosL n=1 Tax=Lacibacter sp. MH-610 TaxID=3020883 RepID=UPI00389145ED
MSNNISPRSRIISIICAVALGVSLLFPLWRIDLTAPQYPEGLGLKIYPHKIGGDVDVVNGLNHYIGMKTLHTNDFIEFTVLPYLIGFFGLFLLLAAFLRKRWFLYTWLVLFVMFGIVAMYDFYRWEYDYGHNLDPNAAIVVPGMAYQPPLIGFKQLLNFGAYSFPDVGGYIFLAVGLLMLIVAYFEWKKAKARRNRYVTALLFPIVMMMQGCSNDPQPIVFGKDACHFCKMIISERGFGAELVTAKGKVYKFDDTHCIISFLKSGTLKEADKAIVYLVDFAQKEKLIPADKAFLLQGDAIRGPMAGNVAAFETISSMQEFQKTWNAQQVKWNDIIRK